MCFYIDVFTLENMCITALNSRSEHKDAILCQIEQDYRVSELNIVSELLWDGDWCYLTSIFSHLYQFLHF